MISLSIDMSDISRVIAPMATAHQWIPQKVDKELPLLGKKIVPIMKKQVRSNRFTGTLESSIVSDYNSAAKEVEIGPVAKRGRFDAGIILQEGTQPISNAPWKPIMAWAIKRGISNPFLVVLKIREQGVSPHPFLLETMETGEFKRAMEESALRLGNTIAAEAISGGKRVGFTSQGASG